MKNSPQSLATTGLQRLYLCRTKKHQKTALKALPQLAYNDFTYVGQKYLKNILMELIIMYKETKRNKSKQINIRATQEEYSLINERSAQASLTLSEFIIKSAVNKKIIVVEGLPDITTELRRIGNNINQLTHMCHTGLITCPELNDVKRGLDDIWRSLNALTRNTI